MKWELINNTSEKVIGIIKKNDNITKIYIVLQVKKKNYNYYWIYPCLTFLIYRFWSIEGCLTS